MQSYISFVKMSLRLLAAILIAGGVLGICAVAHAATYQPFQGGTGSSATPSYGQVLLGTASGVYAPAATSSLGLSGLFTSAGVLTYLNTGSVVGAPYFQATSTTATSTFAGAVFIGSSTPPVALQADQAVIVGSQNSDPTHDVLTVASSTGNRIFGIQGNGAGIFRVENQSGGSVQITPSNTTGTPTFSLVGFNSNSALGFAGLTLASGQMRRVQIFNTSSGGLQTVFTGGTGNNFVGIGTTTPWAALSVEGISTLGNRAIAGYFNATSSVATSTLYGNLTVGSPVVLDLQGPTSGTMTQVDTPGGGCTADGSTYRFEVYTYVEYAGKKHYSSSDNSLILIEQTNTDGNAFQWHLSWAPVPGASGYLVGIDGDPCNELAGQFGDAGNNTSVIMDTGQAMISPDPNDTGLNISFGGDGTPSPLMPITLYPNELVANADAYVNGSLFANPAGSDTQVVSIGTTSSQFGFSFVYDANIANPLLQPYLGRDDKGSYLIQTNDPVGGLVLQNPNPLGGKAYGAIGECFDSSYTCLDDFGSNQMVIGMGDYGYASTTWVITNGPINGAGISSNEAFTIDGVTGRVGLGLSYPDNMFPPDTAFPGKALFDINSNTVICDGERARNDGTGCTEDKLFTSPAKAFGDIGDYQNTPAGKLCAWCIFYTGEGVFQYLVATSTTASNLSYASTTEITAQTASSTNLVISALGTKAGAFIAVDAQGRVIATTTPTNYWTLSGTSLFKNAGTNVGIGTSSPYATLSVVGQAVAAYFTATTTTASQLPYASTTMVSAVTASSTNLYVSALGTPAGTFLAVDSLGHVIATTTPASGSGSNYFTNSGVYTYLTTGTNLGVGTTTPYGLISASSSSAIPAFVARSLGGGGDLYDGYDSSGTLRFRVASNGALSDTFSFNQTGSSNFTSSGFSGVPMTIMGASGQTANLTNWVNNSSVTMAEVSATGLLGLATTTPDSTLDVWGSFRLESASSSVETASISGAIVGLGCDSADTAFAAFSLSSTTAFVTTPESYPGDGLNWFSYALNSSTIRTKICSDVTVTPAASKYVVKIIR